MTEKIDTKIQFSGLKSGKYTYDFTLNKINVLFDFFNDFLEENSAKTLTTGSRSCHHGGQTADIEAENKDKFLALANEENLEATVVAKVKADPRLTMVWNGKTIVDISREFLNSNGAEKHIKVHAEKAENFQDICRICMQILI